MAVPTTLDARRLPARSSLRLVERFRAEVLRAFGDHVERIVLFGSRARGDAHAESDWDLAVFLDHRPTEADREALREITWAVGPRVRGEIQAHLFAGEDWLATTELACNIRDHAVVLHGPAEVPMIERPVLQHARDALAKADRFAELAFETVDDRFEGVVHGSYYAMFHAARAALLAVEGTASTKHGRVVEAFSRMVRRERLGAAARALAKALTDAQKLRGEADYGDADLTEAGRQLREQVAPFVAFCRGLVDQRAECP